MHCSWLTVEATLKLGILHDVHLAPHATGRIYHGLFVGTKGEVHTVTFVLVVIRNHSICPLTYTIAVSRYTITIEQV